MAETELQDRLREHAKAFDGLLSLIPAKMYYGEDTSDQWKKKKQTKDQAKAAKRGKLDPDSELHRNAKEVLDERARNKRKLRELEEEDEDESEDDDDELIPGVEREKPGEGLKKKAVVEEESAAKKPKLSEDVTPETPKSETKKAKEEKKAEKATKKLLKEEAKKAKGKNATGSSAPADEEPAECSTAKETPIKPSTEVGVDEDTEMAPIDVSGLVPEEGEGESTAASSPKSSIFDSQTDAKNTSADPTSTTTSISSTVAPSQKPRLKVPVDTTQLRARLAAKIEALRAARKVDDVNGTPIRTRQELIESRREKQAQRKAHKREMRQLAKEEEDRKREEALASARNSPGSMLSPMIDLDDDRNANHFAFGRLAFADGAQMSHDLTYAKDSTKKKGPLDPKSALAKFEAQKKRLAALDEDKRKEVLEKETWLAARRRAEGEKVHDDESLLKKAVKRKEKAKKKSEREWKDRAKGVEDGIKARQHKREENLKKRRDEKGAKGKKKKGVSTKKKNRPGFEGGFGGGGGKKK
ncbi:surfeit locus protein 6-domain-containing protein [Apodospora peruviana]|uniref:Surfeit locus protein 6-domain-containing protein n=1 Tax=Apodospora peruviana TaxID=516989 RepID=A0AAE0M701_9PEZI|nr:surfeit locus protein 6-domain-containing protein [Apodospora peruviana]